MPNLGLQFATQRSRVICSNCGASQVPLSHTLCDVVTHDPRPMPGSLFLPSMGFFTLIPPLPSQPHTLSCLIAKNWSFQPMLCNFVPMRNSVSCVV